MDKIKWKGVEGQWIEGAPPRDMTREEWDALPRNVRVYAKASGLYANTPEIETAPEPITVINPNDGVDESEASGAGQALRQRRAEKEEQRAHARKG